MGWVRLTTLHEEELLRSLGPDGWIEQLKRTNDWRVFKWNLCSLCRKGAAKELVETLSQYKSDVTTIQKLRWTGTG